MIANRADGIILIMRLEKTDRSLVKKALEELKISGAAILGVVANEVKIGSPISCSASKIHIKMALRAETLHGTGLPLLADRVLSSLNARLLITRCLSRPRKS